MRVLIGLALGIFSIVNGFRVLFAADCATVSFSRAGGRTMAAMQCYADNGGAVPAWLAGLGVILLGFIVIAIGFAGRRPG
jgi:hypothetical protein